MAVEQNPFMEIEEVKELRRDSPSLSLVSEEELESVQFNPTSDGGVEVEFGDMEEIAMMDMEEFENQCDMIGEIPEWIDTDDGGEWSDGWVGS